MRKYYIELEGQKSTLKDISLCFNSPSFQLVENKSGWILVSDEFETYDTYGEVWNKSIEIINQINKFLAIYGKLHSSIKARNVVWLATDGKYKRHITGSISVEVYSSDGINELSKVENGETLGHKLIELCETNSKVKELLNLMTEEPLKWIEIFNIIEFMGDVKGIVKWGFFTKGQVDEIRRTANYYRHLGKPQKSILPSPAPSLEEARLFTEDLICKWLNRQLRKTNR